MDQNRQESESRMSRQVATPYLRRVIADFYRTAVDDYERAGYPFGISIEGMLIWFEYAQETRLN